MPTLPLQKSPRRIPRAAGCAIALIAFLAMAPTLGWLEFSNGIEQLHAATVLEMRREGGSWLMPTLNGTLRIKKPPLPAWIGGLAVTDAIVAGVGSSDRAVRDAAYARLAWEIRWPALVAGCLTLVATFDLARTLAGGLGRRRGLRVALLATLIAATSLLFLRYMRLASTDVHLALWVTVANALIARAMLLGQRWCVPLAGLAVGLGFMCKGPVAILQTVVPTMTPWAFARVCSIRVRRRGDVKRWLAQLRMPRRDRLVRAVLAILAFLAVAVPWPVMVAVSHEGALAIWWKEITRADATELAPDPFWAYLSLLPHLLPWLPAFVVGFLVTLRGRKSTAGHMGRRPLARHRGYLLAFLWLVVPIVVMSFFKDKNERYLLPLLPAAAILAARGFTTLWTGLRRGRSAAGFWLMVQLIVAAGFAVVPAIAGMAPASTLPAFVAELWPQTRAGAAWYSPSIAIPFAAFGIVASVMMIRAMRRSDILTSFIIAAVLMFIGNAMLLWGYRESEEGLSEMRPIAERILTHAPGGRVAYYEESGKAMPPDLSIYLNRVVRPLKAVRRPGEDEPDILVTLQREKRPPPAVDGWRTFAKEPYRQRFWHAMERVAP